jgi:SsrA-binding protein
LQGTVAREGYTLVPLRAYAAHNLIKLEFAVGRGRREYEKRERIKERESKRTIKRAFTHGTRGKR